MSDNLLNGLLGGFGGKDSGNLLLLIVLLFLLGGGNLFGDLLGNFGNQPGGH